MVELRVRTVRCNQTVYPHIPPEIISLATVNKIMQLSASFNHSVSQLSRYEKAVQFYFTRADKAVSECVPSDKYLQRHTCKTTALQTESR